MLKSLEIQGFKSFPDYTKIEFHKGITAIVGPNGAGKSNITDAIRWVLGEQSAKTLRGQRMEDVIFDGTAQRRPVSFSEVTLTIDNSKRILDIEYETVALTRRYYRSGDSEYLINKTACRLKDIHGLLMDTGIGLEGYSIIGQGRVDEILSNKSEDRRALFEEASGIVQYRSRKDEALRKLERSEQNLVRVDDLLAELADRSLLLEKQAVDARAHIELADNFRRLDTALICRQIESLEEQEAKRKGELALAEADLIQARQARQDKGSTYQRSLEGIDELDHLLEDEQKRFNQLSVAETEHSGLDALYKEKYASSKEGAESLLEEKNRLVMMVLSAEEDLAGRASRRADLTGRKDQLTEELQEEKTRLQAMTETMKRLEGDRSRAEGEREEVALDLASLRASLQEHVGESQALKARQDRLKQETALLAEEHRQSLAAQEAFASKEAELEARVKELDEKSLQARQHTLAAHGKADQAEEAMELLKKEISQLSYEADTLERLERDYEGYTRPVQQVMQESKRSGETGLYGPLGALLTVDEEVRDAVDVALGASAHHLVCDKPETAKHWIDWLRRTRAGRATFLPVNSLSSGRVDAASRALAEADRGWIGIAAELVSYDRGIEPAVRQVLGRTLVVESLDDAVRLSGVLNRQFAIVTRTGEIVHRGGSMSGGYRSPHSTGVLGRPGRIQAARNEVRQKEAASLKLSADFEGFKEQLALAASREQETLDLLAAVRRDLAGTAAEHKAARASCERMAGDLAKLEDEAGQTLDRLAQLETSMAQAGETIREKELRRGFLEEEIGRLRQGQAADAQAYDDCRSQVTKLEFSIASILESLAEFDSMTARAGQEIDSSKLRLTSLEREWANQTARMEEARENLAANEEAWRGVSLQINACKENVENLLARRDELFQGQRSLLEQMNQANDHLTTLNTAFERNQSELSRLKQQIDEQLNRLWESHGLTRAEAMEDMAELPSVSRASSERAALKRQIDELGPINHNAIRDFEALTSRIDFTRSQRKDIEQARSELEGVIRELDQSMREQFSQTIHHINQNFNQVFSELFSGGQAEIVLEGEEDVLLADIGIKAQPPGKKLQKLSLLSGGERCLTAIALLFAILKLKPAPFCVFDEVESALDDANVKRFTDYVRRYAWSMQFILVTHRKGTMEASDRLYGVTMQERGISRVLSMVLSSALPYGD